MQKYKTTRWSIDIKPVEVERETPQFYVLKTGRKEAKESHSHLYHDSFIDAVNHLIGKTERSIEYKSEQLAAEKDNLAKLQQLKK